MKNFTLRRLSFGAVCPDGDCNFPARAEALGDLDIDGDMPRICRMADLKPGDVAIDIGAFVGDTACAMAKFGAEVYAFEPFFDSYLSMLYNTQVWRVRGGGVHPTIHPFFAPVGNGERVEYVYECPGPNYGMRSVKETLSPSNVVTFRIDSLNLPRVKLMKIDCEGFEIRALKGATETIKRCRPFLFIEHYVDALEKAGHTAEELVLMIKGLGYQLTMIGEPPRWDWFCIPIAPLK